MPSPNSLVLTSPGVSDQFATLCVESSSTTPVVQEHHKQEHEMSAPDENVNNDLSQDRNHSEGSISINLHIDSLEFNSYELDEMGTKNDDGDDHDDDDDDDVILGGPTEDGSTQFKVTPSPYNRRSPSPGAATTDDTEEDVVEVLNPPPPTETMTERNARIDAWPLTDIAEPGINDCLFGRGGGTNHHPGNKRYRKIVEDRKETYLTSKRLDKPLVAMDIITEWRGQDPPGRFLKQNDITKLWDDVGDKKAREKTSQALREKTPVKQREGEMEQHSDPRQQNARNARFQVGTTSPVSRHNIKRSALARDHSLGGGEGVLENEISLEGFSWEESEEVIVDDEGNRLVVDDDGNRHGYPPPHHYHQQQQYPGDGYYEQYPPPPPGPRGEYYHHPPAYETQHSLEKNSLSDATVTQSAPGTVFADPYYGHHYPPQPPPSQGYEYPPPPPGQGYSPYPPPHNYTSPHQSHHQYHHYSPHNMPSQQQLRTPQDGSSYSHPPTTHDGSLPPPPPPPQGYYGGYPSQHGWPTPPGAGPPQAPPPGASYHHPAAFDRRYDSLEKNDSSRSLGSNNGGGNGYYDGQYGGNMPPKSSTPPRRPPMGSSGKAVLKEDPASAGSSQDYSKLAELIRDSSDTSSSIDRTTSLDTTGGNSSKEKDVRRTMSMPQEGSDRNANDGVNRPDTVKRDTSNVPVERSMKRVVLSRDQSEVARRLKEQQYGAGRGSSKLTKAELLDRKMSVEMNMLGLDDKVLGRVTTEGYLMREILETTSSIEAGEERVSTIDEIALEIADGTPPEEWDDTLDLVGLTESDIAEKWLKGET